MPKLKNKSTKNKSTKNKPTKNNVNKKEHSPLISKKTIDLLQYRIQEEEMSVRIYLSMAMWLENEGYVNASKLWKKYSAEENTHADWAREYLLSFGGDGCSYVRPLLINNRKKWCFKGVKV